jgi:signal transduction histidine kinase
LTLRADKTPKRFYRELASALPLGTAIIHLADTQEPGTWKLLAANTIATHIAGSSVADFLDLPFAHAIAQTLPAKLANLCTRGILRARPVTLGQVRKRNPSGSQEVYMVRAIPLPGSCIGFLFEDVSLLSTSTVARLEIESLLDHMCGAAGAILWRADPVTLQFNLVKPGAKKVLGYWIERWRHEINFWKNHTHRDDWEVVQEHCTAAAANGHKREFDCRMYSAEGKIRWFRVYVQRTDLPAGRAALNGVMVDVTDQLTERAARKLSAQLMQTQEQERKRISRDLHDSVGQYLTGLKLNLAALRGRADCPGDLQDKLQECLDLTETCVEEVRSVSHNLYPPEVELMGLIPALRSYGRHFAERAAIEVRMELPERNERLESDQEIALFRIAQESLTNIQRHAMASSARLRLEVGAETITLEIADTGVGMRPGTLEGVEHGTEGKGIGLLKMRERVHDLGGKLEIESDVQGTVVRAQIPRHNIAAEIEAQARTDSGSPPRATARNSSRPPKRVLGAGSV